MPNHYHFMTNDHSEDNVEIVLDETTEESSENANTELTIEEKEAIAKRKLKKIAKDFPHLLKPETPESDNKKTEQTQSQTKVLSEDEQLLAIELGQNKMPVKDSLDMARKIARRDGISVTEAYTSDEFANWADTYKKRETAKAAQLSATNGGKGSKVKDFKSDDLTPEEHQALFLKKIGR